MPILCGHLKAHKHRRTPQGSQRFKCSTCNNTFDTSRLFLKVPRSEFSIPWTDTKKPRAAKVAGEGLEDLLD